MQKRILSESFQLFKKQGIRYVTMDMIAGHLGVSKKTMYVHFKSKEELLYECLKSYIEESNKQRKAILDAAPNVIEGLISIMRESTNSLSRINLLMFEELERYYPAVSNLLKENRKDEYYQGMIQLIEQGKSEGLIMEKIDADITTKLLFAQMEHITNYELFPIDKYSRIDLFKHVFVSFIRGISTDEGQSIIKELLTEEEGIWSKKTKPVQKRSQRLE